MIRTSEELKKAAANVSALLQDMQNYLGRKNDPNAKFKFPRGFFTSASEIRDWFSFVNNETIRSNLSYAVMYIDLLTWLVIRTDLVAAPLDMVTKNGICVLGELCETLTHYVLVPKYMGKGNKKNNFRGRTDKLVELGVISKPLKDDIDWIWQVREKVHIFLVGHLEWSHYTKKDFNRALRTFTKLRDELEASKGIEWL